MFQHALDRLNGSDREPFGRKCRAGIPHDTRDGREPEGGRLVLRHDDQCCGAIVTRRRVPDREHAVILEDRFQRAHLAEVDPGRLLVLGDQAGRTFFLRSLDRYDLAFEGPGGDGLLGSTVALHREIIQFLSGQLVLRRAELPAVPHMKVVVHVPQPVFDETVGQLTVAEAVASPGVLKQIGCAGHAFHPAGDHNARIAHPDRLSRHDHGLQA